MTNKPKTNNEKTPKPQNNKLIQIKKERKERKIYKIKEGKRRKKRTPQHHNTKTQRNGRYILKL